MTNFSLGLMFVIEESDDMHGGSRCYHVAEQRPSSKTKSGALRFIWGNHPMLIRALGNAVSSKTSRLDLSVVSNSLSTLRCTGEYS